jgi:hypothetical protein
LGWYDVGANYFYIYVRPDNGQWYLAANNLTGTSFNITGLSPSTKYFIEVVSVCANGTQPRSGVFSVTTSGSSGGGNNNGGSSSGSNIAAGKPFAVSSIFGSGYEGWKSNDGNRNSRWASAASGATTAQWVYYDLQANYNISSVRLYFEAAYSRDFNIQTWNGSQWVNVTGLTNNTNLSPGLGVNRTARYIRFFSARHNFNLVSSYEFEVFGTFASSGKSASQTQGKDVPPPGDLQYATLTEDKDLGIFPALPEALQFPTISEPEVKELKIYPNPAKENFSISLKEFKNAKVTITDMMGRTVYEANTDKSELEIRKSGVFNSGIYIINVLDENNESHMRKLIIE